MSEENEVPRGQMMLSEFWGKCLFFIVPCVICFLIGTKFDSKEVVNHVLAFLGFAFVAHYIWSVMDLQELSKKERNPE